MTMRIKITLAATLLASGCSYTPEEKSQDSIADYNRTIVKVDDADLECQVTEGDRKASKFYANIKSGTFVRSAYYELDYDPGNALPAISEGPTRRDRAEDAAARTMAAESKPRDNVIIGSRMQNFGRDQGVFCLNYFVMGLKDRTYTASCAYWYNPFDRTIELKRFPSFKANGEPAAPLDSPSTTTQSRIRRRRWRRPCADRARSSFGSSAIVELNCQAITGSFAALWITPGLMSWGSCLPPPAINTSRFRVTTLLVQLRPVPAPVLLRVPCGV